MSNTSYTEYQNHTEIPERYIVLHEHESYDGEREEEAWASYNTSLPNAYNLAVHTASRYHGEIFAEFGDGVLKTVKSYRR